MASAAIATQVPTTLFFTMEATHALRKAGPDGQPGWGRLPVAGGTETAAERDRLFRERGVAAFEELLSACVTLGVKVMVCEMGLRALGLAPSDLREDVPVESGGVVTFLADASGQGAMLFV